MRMGFRTQRFLVEDGNLIAVDLDGYCVLRRECIDILLLDYSRPVVEVR